MRAARRWSSSRTTRRSPGAQSAESPSATVSWPSRQTASPADPAGRTASPAGQTAAPAGRAAGPATRTTAPAGRAASMRRTRRSSRRRVIGAASRFRLHDLVSEAMAGLLQRPGRSALTMLGTVLGIGGFVAIVGLSQTANGQIGSAFNRLDATQVTVADTAAARASVPTLDFPPGADALVDRINGVVAAGVWWNVPFKQAAVS